VLPVLALHHGLYATPLGDQVNSTICFGATLVRDLVALVLKQPGDQLLKLIPVDRAQS
jgi:hypothetical protein